MLLPLALIANTADPNDARDKQLIVKFELLEKEPHFENMRRIARDYMGHVDGRSEGDHLDLECVINGVDLERLFPEEALHINWAGLLKKELPFPSEKARGFVLKSLNIRENVGEGPEEEQEETSKKKKKKKKKKNFKEEDLEEHDAKTEEEEDDEEGEKEEEEQEQEEQEEQEEEQEQQAALKETQVGQSLRLSLETTQKVIGEANVRFCHGFKCQKSCHDVDVDCSLKGHNFEGKRVLHKPGKLLTMPRMSEEIRASCKSGKPSLCKKCPFCLSGMTAYNKKKKNDEEEEKVITMQEALVGTGLRGHKVVRHIHTACNVGMCVVPTERTVVLFLMGYVAKNGGQWRETSKFPRSPPTRKNPSGMGYEEALNILCAMTLSEFRDFLLTLEEE